MGGGGEGEGPPGLEPPSVKSLGEATKGRWLNHGPDCGRSTARSMLTAFVDPTITRASSNIIVLNIRRSRVSRPSPLNVSRPEER